MSPEYEMKILAAVLTNDSRTLRRFEIKARNQMRKTVARGAKRNYPEWAERRLLCYNERMAVRGLARHVHLARAFLKGKDYRDVEQTTREGNEPDLEALMSVFNNFDLYPPMEYVRAWME